MIFFKNISKKYKDKIVLDNLTFSIDKGKIIGYIGPNGAGKTTTLKIIVGLIKDFDGEYYCFNNKMPENYANVQKYFGYLPQNVAFQEWRTIEQALKTFGILSGLRKELIDERIKTYISLFEIQEPINKKIAKLSGGTVQKIGIIQALLHHPEILILDEPLNGLDPLSRINFKKVLLDLKDKGISIVFSSHILSDVQDLVDEIIVINNGKIIAQGDINFLREKAIKFHKLQVSFYENSIPENLFKEIDDIINIEQKSVQDFILSVNKNTDFYNLSKELMARFYKNNLTLKSFYLLEPDLDEIYSNLLESEK